VKLGLSHDGRDSTLDCGLNGVQEHKNTKNTAVVLLSGGLDSATVSAKLIADGYEVIALSIDYGQRHVVELAAAQKLARLLGVKEHVVMPMDMNVIGASALTDDRIEVPKDDDANAAVAADIPITYVPARNTIFLSLALALAESRGAHHIGIGVNALDYSGYPDCRPEFIAAFEKLVNLATREGVEGRSIKLLTPLQDLSKVEILQLARKLAVPVDECISCYDPRPKACGECDSCRLRIQAEAKLSQWNFRAPQSVAEIVDLRHRNLRQNQARETAFYPEVDELASTRHLMAEVDGQLAGCATLQVDPSSNESCRLRIRGMAVDEQYRGIGLGSAMVRWCQSLAAESGDGIWCNARILAVPMYARCGFKVASDIFEIENIGPHYNMEWQND